MTRQNAIPQRNASPIMSALADPAWQTKLRYRLEDFRATALFGRAQPVSLKLRPPAGHFDRTGAPQAYAQIDARARGLLSSTVWLGDHDTGPEILCGLSDTDGRRTLRAPVLALLGELLTAAHVGRAAGDPLAVRLELLLRGFDAAGAYFEHGVLVADLTAAPVTADALRAALAAHGIGVSAPPQRRLPR